MRWVLTLTKMAWFAIFSVCNACKVSETSKVVSASAAVMETVSDTALAV